MTNYTQSIATTHESGRSEVVVTCSCGFRSAWGVQDGSAEAEAADHKAKHERGASDE